MLHEAGEAEVGEFGLVVGVDDDVAGFDVAVDDAAAVGELDGVADLLEDLDGATGGEEVFADEVEDIAAVDEFHDEDAVFLDDSEFEDGGDVRVDEAGHGLGLGAEAVDGFAVAAGVWREDFDGDGAVEVALEACVDCAHATGGDEPLNGVLGQHAFQFGRFRRDERDVVVFGSWVGILRHGGVKGKRQQVIRRNRAALFRD